MRWPTWRQLLGLAVVIGVFVVVVAVTDPPPDSGHRLPRDASRGAMHEEVVTPPLVWATPPVPAVATTTTTWPTVYEPTPAEANDLIATDVHPSPTSTTARDVSRAGAWTTSSTMYCLRGTTASGATVADGLVAVSMSDFARLRGTRWQVTAGPPEILGRVFTVADKGPAARFDMWTGSCATARRYGRRTITVSPA